MSDTKISGLVAGTAVLVTDLLVYVEDPGGTPVTKKITIANFIGSLKADVLDAGRFAADAGSNDTYVATLAPAITAYVTGVHYRFKAATANTGAATINFNGLGAKSIVKAAGGITTALADNDIRAGQWVDLVYDGTNMQMQSTLGNAAAGTFTNPGAGASSEHFGLSSTAAGVRGASFGSSAVAAGDDSTAIGTLTSIGAGGTNSIVLGSQSSLNADGAIVIGKGSGNATGNTTAANSILIGNGGCALTANTMVVGSGTQAINVLYGGKGESHATPVVFTVSGTHGLGADKAAGDLALRPGAGTGTGAAGAIVFYTAPAGSTSSTRNSFVECARFTTTGVLAFPSTVTAGGTTGNQTINKQSGTVNIAAAGTTVAVTNSLVTTSSIVMAVIRTADATARIANVVPSNGSFVINIVATTAEVSIGFVVLNQ